MAMQRIIMAIALAFLVGCSQQPPKAEFTLTYASPYPPSHPFSKADSEWMDWVKQQSGGRIAFRTFWSGSLLSSDMSMTEIRHGLADVGLITPIYARGGAHMLRAQSGFYGGIASIADQVTVYDCLAARFPQFGKELEGLHVLAVQGGNFPGGLKDFLASSIEGQEMVTRDVFAGKSDKHGHGSVEWAIAWVARCGCEIVSPRSTVVSNLSAVIRIWSRSLANVPLCKG